jgi:hypothetical protein
METAASPELRNRGDLHGPEPMLRDRHRRQRARQLEPDPPPETTRAGRHDRCQPAILALRLCSSRASIGTMASVLHRTGPGRGRSTSQRAVTQASAKHQPPTTSDG